MSFFLHQEKFGSFAIALGFTVKAKTGTTTIPSIKEESVVVCAVMRCPPTSDLSVSVFAKSDQC